MKDRQATIVHELVHLSLSKNTRPFTPGWVVEGIALHFAKQHNSWSRLDLRKSRQLDKLHLRNLSRRHVPPDAAVRGKTTFFGFHYDDA